MPTNEGNFSGSLANLARLVRGPWQTADLPNSGFGKGPAPKADPHRRLAMLACAGGLIHYGAKVSGSHRLEDIAKTVHVESIEVGGRLREESQVMAALLPKAAERTFQQAGFFYTDFTEHNPQDLWRSLLPDGFVVDRQGRQAMARSIGPSFLLPLATMSSGSAMFHFMSDGDRARFLFRAQDHRNCYEATLSRLSRSALLVRLVRHQRNHYDRTLKVALVDHPELVRLDGQRLSIELAGSEIAVRLHWEKPGRFGLQTLDSRVVASCKDSTYPAGAVGAWGPARRWAPGFRMFSVKLNA